MQSTSSLDGILKTVGDSFEVRTTFLPRLANPKYARGNSLIGGNSLYVSNRVSDAELKVIFEFFKYLSRTDVSVYWHKNTGYFPATNAAVKALMDEGWFTQSPNHLTAFLQILSGKTDTDASAGMRMGPSPSLGMGPTALEKIANGEDPKAALKYSAEQVNALWLSTTSSLNNSLLLGGLGSPKITGGASPPVIFTFLGARGGFELNRFPNHRILPYALVMPSIAVIAIFLIIPFGQAVYLSFHRVSPFGALRNVGWRNYVEMFASAEYLFSFRNTMIFSALVIGVGLTIALCIALLTTQKIRGAAFYQIAFIWTYAMSPIIAGVMWSLIFDPAIGIMARLIGSATGHSINYFTDQYGLSLSDSIGVIMLGYNICFFRLGPNVPPREGSGLDRWGHHLADLLVVTFPTLSLTTAFLVFVTVYAFFQSHDRCGHLASPALPSSSSTRFTDGFWRIRGRPQLNLCSVVLIAIGAVQIYIYEEVGYDR